MKHTKAELIKIISRHNREMEVTNGNNNLLMGTCNSQCREIKELKEELYLTQKWCKLVGQNEETSTLNDYLLNEYDEQAEGDKIMEGYDDVCGVLISKD